MYKSHISREFIFYAQKLQLYYSTNIYIFSITSHIRIILLYFVLTNSWWSISVSSYRWQIFLSFFQGKTSVKRHSYCPVWNEQLVFTEMFPPLCQRIKVQLRDAGDAVRGGSGSVIGTHHLDLKHMSNDGEKGKWPLCYWIRSITGWKWH